MILRQILVVFFSLTRASNATSSDLAEDVSKLSIKDTNSIEVAGFSEALPTLEDIISQGDALRTSTLNDNIETVVSRLNQLLLNLLELGVAPLNVTPIINCFPFAAEELVLAAQNVQAYILLKLLQMIYIWRDDAQFHWFQALTYHSPWYDEEWWNNCPMNWENNLQAVCMWDNDDLAVTIQKSILVQKALDIFNENLILQCSRYDSIRIFKTMQMEPSQLGGYFKIMATYGSIRLLRLYQSGLNVKHLHLERFPFLGRLPASVDDFAFLMNHGYDCFPMGHFIERFCKEGRLDLLKFLYRLDPKLIPYKEDLILAAEKGWLDILQWGSKLIQKWQVSKSLAVQLAVNGHLGALDWLIDEYNLIVNSDMLKEIIVVGNLKVLQWIYEKQPFQCKQEWVGLAAEKCRLPIFKWLCETFEFIPTAYDLRNATAEILDWIKATYNTLIDADLIECGAGNFELLQWAHKNVPISIFNDQKLAISLSIKDRTAMQWLYNELKIFPASMNWAYKTGDLEAIQWALTNFQILPTVENIVCAIEKGHLSIIKWLHENYPKYLRVEEAVKLSKSWGSVEVAGYIASIFGPKTVLNFEHTGKFIDWDQCLDDLQWIHKHGHCFAGCLTKEINRFVLNGQLQPFLRFIKAFPEVKPSWPTWHLVAEHGYHEIYKWHLENCSIMYQTFKLKDDIQAAFVNGHLEIVRLILHKYPKHYGDVSKLDVTRANYHIKRWLDINFEPVKGFSLKGIFADQ